MNLTFLFTDIEGSTRLWETNQARMAKALAYHDALLRQLVTEHSGQVFKTVGDAFCCVFDSADQAVKAAIEIQTALSISQFEGVTLKVRFAIHSGPAQIREDDFFGPTLNRVARLLSIASGEQILLSGAAYSEMKTPGPVIDLGEHFLKDLNQPMRVYQAADPSLPQNFPPLRSLPKQSHNLPIQLTSFVGREKEMETLSGLLRDNRLVTLTGTGGAGKTRLAIQCAAEIVERFKDGVYLVELAALTDPAHVAGAIAKAVRVAEASGTTVVESLQRELQQSVLLIILDNCEHLVDACAEIAEALLQNCPGVRILATSRESLGVAGEQNFRTPSLSVPSAKDDFSDFANSPSIRLFWDRASLADSNFKLTETDKELTAKICEKLDGVPLAIELAAACCSNMSLNEISDLLGDRFRLLTSGRRTALPRQKTLRAMVDWSYDLLSQEERQLLCSLSAFSGGWTISTLSGVFPEMEGLHALHSSLVRKSLVTREVSGQSTRFRLLQTIRDYASDRLIKSGSGPEVRKAHQTYFEQLVRDAVRPLKGPDQKEWLDLLEIEHDNIRSTLHQHASEGDPSEKGLEMCGLLFFFWWMRSHWEEGRAWCDTMLGVTAGAKPSKARSDCLLTAGNLAIYQGEYAEAESFYQQSFAIRESLNDPASTASVLHCLAHLHQMQENFKEAKPLYEKCIALRRVADDPDWLAGSLNNLANVEQELGDFDSAAVLHGEALAIRRSLGSIQGLAQSLQNLGSLSKARGQFETSLDYFEESLTMFHSLRDTRSVGQVLDGLAELYYALGNRPFAVKLWSASKAVRITAGTYPGGAAQMRMESFWGGIEQEMGAEEFQSAWADGSHLDLDGAFKLAFSRA